jgi:predicted Zn finger-like uncharacterized protein
MNGNNEMNQLSFQKIVCPNCSSENVFLLTKLYSLQGEDKENHRKFSVGGWILLLAGLFIVVRFGIWFFEGDLSFLRILPLIAAGFWMTRWGVYYALFYIANDKTKLKEKIKVRCSNCNNKWIEPIEKGMQLPPVSRSRKVLNIVLWVFGGLMLLVVIIDIILYL